MSVIMSYMVIIFITFWGGCTFTYQVFWSSPTDPFDSSGFIMEHPKITNLWVPGPLKIRTPPSSPLPNGAKKVFAEATRTTSASVAMLVGASTTAGTMRMPRWQVVVRPASLGLSNAGNAHSSPLQLNPNKKTFWGNQIKEKPWNWAWEDDH